MLDLTGLVDLMKELNAESDDPGDVWCKVNSDGSGSILKGTDGEEVLYNFDDEDELLEIILDRLNSINIEDFFEEMD